MITKPTSRIAPAVCAWAIGLAAASIARAHGGPPIIDGVLVSDEQGPLVVELSEGLALRGEDATWSFVCPALFGADLPPANAAVANEAWLAGRDDLYRIGPGRTAIAAERMDLAGTPVLALASLADLPLVLRLRATDDTVDGSEVVRPDGELVEFVYSVPVIWSALAVLPPHDDAEPQLWLARLEADGVEVIGITTDGVELDRQLVLLPAEPLAVRLTTAGEHVFAHVIENGGHTLLHVATRGVPPFEAKQVVQAGLPVRGPALRDGEILLTRDDELLSWTPDGIERSDSAIGAETLTCLSPDHVCTERALYSAADVERAGYEDAAMLLDLALLAPPELVPEDAELAQQCDLQWMVFRADLIRTGVMTLGNVEPEPPLPDAGPDASDDAGSLPITSSSSGCSVRSPRAGTAWLATLAWLAIAFARRARRFSS